MYEGISAAMAQAAQPTKVREEVAVDPWKHRTKGMVCSSCMWFVPKEPIGPQTHEGQYQLGRCRRHAPTMGGFPAVFRNDWCGDHRIDENKL